jgi:hypothetical protein
MRKTFGRVVVAAAIAAGALTACSTTPQAPPAQAVSDSFSNLANQSSLSVRLSLGVTATQLGTLATSNGDKGLSPSVANTIANGSIFLDVQTTNGKALNDTSGGATSNANVDLGLRVGSTKPIEIRVVDGSLYARINADQFAADTGQSPASMANFKAGLQKADQMVPGLSALANDRWVEVSKSSLQALLNMAKEYGATQGQAGSANQSQNRAATSKLMSSIAHAFRTNATVTSDGTHGSGTYYTVTVPIRAFVDQVATAIQTYLNSVPGGSAVAGKFAGSLNQAVANNNQTLTLQVVVRNNKASEVDLDVNQFLSGSNSAPFPVPVQLKFGTSPDIVAPHGAVALNLANIPSLLGGMAQRAGATSA